MTNKISSHWKSCCSVPNAIIFPWAFRMQTQMIISVCRWLHPCPCHSNLALDAQLFPCSSVSMCSSLEPKIGRRSFTANIKCMRFLCLCLALFLCVRQMSYLWSFPCFSVLYWELSCSNVGRRTFALLWCLPCGVSAHLCQALPAYPQKTSRRLTLNWISVFALVNGFVLTSAIHKA